MSSSVVGHLISKDWRLHRFHVLLSLVGGAAALALFQVKREVPFVLGAVWFFVALIVFACMLPVTNVVNERKKQNLAFVMSLPVSARQYAMSKIASTFGMFLVPWIALVGCAVLLIEARGLPHGAIPTALMLNGLVLVGFFLIASVAIVSESEAWTAGATIVCNASYGVVWYLIVRVPGALKEMGSPVVIWSPRILTILAVECVLIAIALGLTFYLQSKKRDFV
jgi:hypothetical protein